MSGLDDLMKKLVQRLAQKQQTLATAESCTGGLLAELITDVAGASKIFIGGVVTYSNAMKMKWLGVSSNTLAIFGAVSEQTVHEMIEGIQQATGCDYAIAVSGIAGPAGGTPEKPVGTVVIGWKLADEIVTEKYLLKGNRREIREQSAMIAFRKIMTGLSDKSSG